MTIHQVDSDETHECLLLLPHWISHDGAHRPWNSISLDHVLPVAVVPELAARFYNLEAIPAKANLAKSDIGQRELDLARRWRKAGLLSAAGLAAVETK